MAKQASAGCLVLFGLPFLAVGLGVLFFGGFALLEARSAESWPTVPARIEAVEVHTSHSSKGGTTRTLHVRYAYEVGGVRYEGDRVGPDVTSGAYLDREGVLDAHRLSGEPVPCRVDPSDPRNALLYTDVSPIGVIAFPAFGLVFAGAGGGIIAGGLVGAARQRRRDRRAAEHPDRPWHHEGAWSDFRAPAEAGPGTIIGMWLAGAFMGLFISIFVVVLAGDPNAPFFAKAIIAFFALIPFGLLGGALYMTLRYLKYGRPVLHLTTVPVPLGGALEGAIEVRAAIDAREGVKLTLKCTQTTVTGSGKNRSTHTVSLHEESVVVPEHEVRSVRSGLGAATLVPVRFATVPADRPARSTEGNPTYAWKLEAHCETPGVDFGATFDLPVFACDPALVERRGAPMPS